MKEHRRENLLGKLAIIGPGLLIAATGVGAGDLATAALAGMKLGPAVLWAVVAGAFCKFVLNEGLARYQLATGETLLEGALRKLGVGVAWLFLPYLLIWTLAVGAALMSACGVALHALLPVFDDAGQGKLVWGVLSSVAGVALVRLGGFRLFEWAMNTCIVVMFVMVLYAALRLQPDWGAAGRGLLLPRIPDADGKGLGWTIALMGGVGGTLTVLCYGYWIRAKGRTTAADLRICRIDLAVGYGATALFGLAMVLIGSTVTNLEGKGAGLVVKLAAALEPVLGGPGKLIFLLGAFGAVFSSLLGVWQAVPLIFVDFVGLLRERQRQRNPRPAPAAPNIPEEPPATGATVRSDSPLYRLYLAFIAIGPMIALSPRMDFTLVQKTYSIIGAFFMPLLALALLLLNGRQAWVGAHRNRALTVAVLVGMIVFFAYAGWLGAD